MHPLEGYNRFNGRQVVGREVLRTRHDPCERVQARGPDSVKNVLLRSKDVTIDTSHLFRPCDPLENGSRFLR